MSNGQHIGGIDELRALLSPEWMEAVGNVEFGKSYWPGLIKKLNELPTWLPKKCDIFNALNACPPNKVKVVIIGQDPYPTPGNAHGFSFSVNKGIRVPASLRNIFNEIADEYNMPNVPSDGMLKDWANEGVLLLNSILTVSPGQPNSHTAFGWQNFTGAILRHIDATRNDVVFMAWGRPAQQLCDEEKIQNKVLTAGHPSPINTTNPFRGCGCFRECNEYLISKNRLPVRWCKVWT